jgi:hypothetical protein
MGLKHLPLVNIMLIFSIFTGITPWWGKPEWKVMVLWLLVEGQQKMLVNFAMVIRVASVSGTWQIKHRHDVLLSHNNQKRDP